jgi:hypothetical protein
MSARMLLVLVASSLAVVPGLAMPGRALAANDDCCVISIAGLDDVLTAGDASDLTMGIVKQTKGCTPLRRAVAVQLAGLTAAQLRIDRVVGGQSVPLPAAKADADMVWAPDVLTDPKKVCSSDGLTVQYRLTFSPDAPPGQAAIVVAAFTESGKLIDRAVTVRAVVSEQGAAGAGGSAPTSPAGQPPEQQPPVLPSASSAVMPPSELWPTYGQAPGTSAASPPAPSGSAAVAPGVAAADPPAGSGGAPVGAGLSARSIAARLSLTAFGLMLLGSVGWLLCRRLNRGAAEPAATIPQSFPINGNL